MTDGFELSSDPDRIDAKRVHRWLSTDAHWALGRSQASQDQAMAASVNFGAYESRSGTQVAYARVVTDHTTFAWLCDVYVDPAVRGQGVGTALVEAVRDHLEPLGVRRILLSTPDAHEVYARVGFRGLEQPGKWMVLGRE